MKWINSKNTISYTNRVIKWREREGGEGGKGREGEREVLHQDAVTAATARGYTHKHTRTIPTPVVGGRLLRGRPAAVPSPKRKP